MSIQWSPDFLAAQLAICEAATPGPWHYYPCGEKSNDCMLGVAYDENSKSPPCGMVDPSPYNEKKRDYEEDKYMYDPVIATMEDNANYADFAFMVHARTNYPLALAEIERLTAARERAFCVIVERDDEIFRLTAERDRMKAALEAIVDYGPRGVMVRPEFLKEMAREALA